MTQAAILLGLAFAAGPPTATPLPRRVTATFRDAKLEDVFAEIRRQTGYRIKIEDNHANHHDIRRTFTGTFRDATFWEAFDAICRKCGAQHAALGDRNIAWIWPASAKRAHSSCHGLFRIIATEVILSRHVSLTDGDGGKASGHRQLKVVIDLAIEPRFGLLVGKEMVREAVDERGRSLLIGVDFWRCPDKWTGDGEVTLYLKPPRKGAKRIAVLKGTIRVKVPAGSALREVDVPFEFRDLPIP
jgi:hypothetical protein